MSESGVPLARAFARLEFQVEESAIQSAVRRAAAPAQHQAEKEGRTLGESLKRGLEFGAGFYGGEALFRGVTEGIKTVIESADELKEASERTERVFGESSESVLQFGKDAAKSYGLSAEAADQMSVKLGALLTNLHLPQEEAAKMSIQLIKLAADLAAFNHTDTASAEQALQSALAGRTQGLKQYGIVVDAVSVQQQALKDGLIKTINDALDPAAKAQATYEVILQRSAVQQGAFARGSGSLAEQTKILKAEVSDAAATVGQKLVPVLVDGAKGLQDMGRDAGNLVDFFEHNSVAASGLAAVLGAAAVPKLVELANVSQRFVAVKLEDALASSAGGIRAMGAALLENPELYALAAGLAAAGVAVELFGHKEHAAAIDVGSLTDAVKAQDTVGGSSLYDDIIKQFSTTDIANKGENVLEYLQRYKINVAQVIQDLSSGNLYGQNGLFKLTIPIFSDPTVSGATQDKLSNFFIGLSNDVESTRKEEAAGEKQHDDLVASLNRTPEGRFTLFMQGIQAAQKGLAQATTANNTALNNQIDVLKGYSAQADVTADSIKQHILDSIRVITQEGNNVATLAANGVSSRFIDKLKAEGPEYVAAVASQAPEVQRQLSGLFQDSRVAALASSKQMAAAEAPALASTVRQGASFVAAAANATFRDTVAKAVAAARQIADNGGSDAASGFGIHGERGKGQVLQHMLNTLPAPVRTATLQALGIATDAGGRLPQNLAAAIESHKPVAVSAAESLRIAVQARIDALHGKTIDVITQDNASAALATITGNIKSLEAYNETLKATRIGAADGGKVSGPGGPRDDVIPAWLSNEEHVTNAASANVNRMFLSWMDSHPGQPIPGFAAGGPVDKGSSTLDQISTHPFVQSFADSLTSGSLSAFASLGGVSGNVQSWLPVVLQALALNGAPASWAPRVLAQIQFESGGDPNIHQQVIDINTFNGSGGAQGLMQVLYSTFMSNHVPGTSMNIFDPLANVAAGIHHAIFEDPGGLAYLGQGHGYDYGGILPPGGWGVNTSRDPEMVRSKTQEDALEARLVQLIGQVDRLIHTVDRSAGKTGATLGGVLQVAARNAHLDRRTRPGARAY